MSLQNHALAEEIRAYWGKRSESFDLSFAHAIAEGAEFKAWAAEIAQHLPAAPTDVLELGSGTGEFTRVLLSLGHRVTGLDFTPEMIARAREKHRLNERVRFHLADAQNTMERDASHDVVIARHLTWTLTDPSAAYTDWFRLLRPAGCVVLFDGNWAQERPLLRRLAPLIRALGRNLPDPVDPAMLARHEAIMAALPYGQGLSAERLAADLAEAGFEEVTIHSHARVTRGMGKGAPLARKLGLYRWHRYIVTARKPR